MSSLSLFLSYARADDEPFVKHLYEDLTAHGFQVWWDRESMPNRALEFSHEIALAIDHANRMIVIIGPAAVNSRYVQDEWKYALATCKPVIALLRQGDYESIPRPLSDYHCPDFCETRSYDEALEELLRLLHDPVVTPGPLLTEVMSLPQHFLPRYEVMTALWESVRPGITRQTTVITSVRQTQITLQNQTTALHGMGGIGKTMLAVALARACEVRRAFPDGVIWLTVGQSAELTSLFQQIGAAFNDGELKVETDREKAGTRLAQFLQDCACLIVLDDVWDVTRAEPFKNVLSERSHLLITTRDGGLAAALGAQECRVDVLNDEAALKLLSAWAEVNSLPDEALEVARECGNLPFALSLCGAMFRDGIPWTDLLAALREADLSFIEKQFPNYPYSNVFRVIKVSMDALEPGVSKLFSKLVVFPENISVPETVVLKLWMHGGALSERDARKLLTTLGNKSLLRLEGKAPNRLVTLHDLQRDYLCTMAPDSASLRNELLAAYEKECHGDWRNGPQDGYFHTFLPQQLVSAGRNEELLKLLFDFRWLEAKLVSTNVNDLVRDYDLALVGLVPGAQFKGIIDGNPSAYISGPTNWLGIDIERLNQLADNLRLVQGAIRLSAHVLDQDERQLAGQLLGRLPTNAPKEVLELLDTAQHVQSAPWLSPLKPSLTSPGGYLTRTLVGHTSLVSEVTLSPNDKYIISAAGYIRDDKQPDSSIRVWDFATGQELMSLEGHSDSVATLGITANGQHIVSASTQFDDQPYEHLVKVWDLTTGSELRSFYSHLEWVHALAISPDNKYIVLAGIDLIFSSPPDPRPESSEHILIVIDIDSGGRVRVLRGHSDSINAVILTPDGHYVISASSDRTIRIWNLKDETESITLTGHTDAVNSVVVSRDGKHLFSGSSDHTLRIWDLESGKQLHKLHDAGSSFYTLTVTSNGRQAIYGMPDHTIKISDLKGDAEPQVLSGHYDSISSIIISSDDRFIVSASKDTTIKIWDLWSKSGSYPYESHKGYVRNIVPIAEKQQAVSTSRDGTCKVWDLSGGLELLTIHSFSNTKPVIIPEQNRLLCASGNVIRVLGLEDGQELFSLIGHEMPITALAITPDHQRVISATGLHTVGRSQNPIQVWDLESRKEVFTLPGHTNLVSALAVSQDGQFLVSASWDDSIKVWNLQDGLEIFQLQGCPFAYSVFITPDDQRILSISSDFSLNVWDLRSGKKLSSFRGHGHSEEVSLAVLTLDGAKAVFTSEDCTLRMWDMVNSSLPAVLQGRAECLWGSAVTRDGRELVLGSEKDTLKVWDLERKRDIAHFTVESKICAGAISPDGTKVIAGDTLGQVHFLQLNEVHPYRTD